MSEAFNPPERDANEIQRRLRAAGWDLPDVNSPEFAAEVRRQSQAIASSPYAEDDMAFVESISWLFDEDPDEDAPTLGSE